MTRGCRRMNASVASSSAVGLPPALDTARRARPLGCSSSAFIRCSVSTICCEYCLAISGAAVTACRRGTVNPHQRKTRERALEHIMHPTFE